MGILSNQIQLGFLKSLLTRKGLRVWGGVRVRTAKVNIAARIPTLQLVEKDVLFCKVFEATELELKVY